MSKFVAYTGDTHTKRKGREISPETQELRDALLKSYTTGKYMSIPGTTDKDLKKWTAKCHAQIKFVDPNLRVRMRLTDDGNVAFLAYDPNAPTPIAVLAPPEPAEETPKPVRRRATRKRA